MTTLAIITEYYPVYDQDDGGTPIPAWGPQVAGLRAGIQPDEDIQVKTWHSGFRGFPM